MAVCVGHTDVQVRMTAAALEQAAVALRAAADDVKREYEPQPGAGSEYGMEAERG